MPSRPPAPRWTAASIASLPAETRKAILTGLSGDEAVRLLHDWRFWARPAQLAPAGRWRIWLILAGRGFGKTRAGAEWVRARIETGRAKRIALVGETLADARQVMVEGESGLLAISPPWNRPLWQPSLRRLSWPNGAIATAFSADDPEQLRGPQFDAAWADELAKWRHPAAWDNLMFALRLGSDPRCVATTTPRPRPWLKPILSDPATVVTRGSTRDNAANLAPGFLAEVLRRYEGTRLGRQEIDGVLLEDVPGALWPAALLESAQEAAAPDLVRIVVAVDPSGSAGSGSGDTSDETGILVAGRDAGGTAHVLADRSGRMSPAEWGRAAIAAYREFRADRLIAERNFGGAMVGHVISTVDPGVPVSLVTASHGKRIRAEPVAALYEQGRVKHLPGLALLEAQMAAFAREGYQGEGSPDRLDALVWALSDLMLRPGLAGSAELEGFY